MLLDRQRCWIIKWNSHKRTKYLLWCLGLRPYKIWSTTRFPEWYAYKPSPPTRKDQLILIVFTTLKGTMKVNLPCSNLKCYTAKVLIWFYIRIRFPTKFPSSLSLVEVSPRHSSDGRVALAPLQPIAVNSNHIATGATKKMMKRTGKVQRLSNVRRNTYLLDPVSIGFGTSSLGCSPNRMQR